MGLTLKLDPDNAAKSIARRIETIEKAEDYVRETYRRYAGLRTFESRLEELGVAVRVRKIDGE